MGARFVYDDDCGFCTWWAEFFETHTALDTVGFSDLDSGDRDRLPEDYTRCAHLLTGEEVYSCGAAVEEAFLRSDLGELAEPAIEVFRQFGAYEQVRERGYREVADTRALWGTVLSSDRQNP